MPNNVIIFPVGLGGSGGGPPVSTVTHTAQQDLALAPLNTTTAFLVANAPGHVDLHFTDGLGTPTPLPGPQTITITIDNAAGVDFDTIVEEVVLGAGTEDYFFAFPASTVIGVGDQINVQVTNAGAPAVFANVSIMVRV